jgi:predicted Zn-dependent protease with MMP-like domain
MLLAMADAASGAGAAEPTIEDIERLAQEAVERLPEGFRAFLTDVVLRVEDFAAPDVVDEMELDTPYDLLGLYRGYPVGEKSSWISGALPDMIHLYRVPILEEWRETGEELPTLVAHVIVHEVGHHFGLSDEDMERIEAEAG